MPNMQTIDYINGIKNATLDEFIIGRERSGNSELITVSLPGSDKPLYSLWNSKKTSRKYRVVIDGDNVRYERVKMKGTGGQYAYVMVKAQELDRLDDISLEARGVLMTLLRCLEWNTCRLIRKRDGKALTADMMAVFLGLKSRTLRKYLAELKAAEIIRYDSKEKAYYMDNRLIRKGEMC
jgi:hypothetical protein